MNYKRISTVALILAVFAAPLGNACGPFFPDSFILDGRESSILNLIRVPFWLEIHRVLGIEPPQPVEHASSYPMYGVNPPIPLEVSSVSPWKSTINSDQTDLRAALESTKQTGIDEIVQQYAALRQSITDFYGGEDTQFELNNREIKKLFDLDAHQALLDRLPQEFTLYIMGANAYRANRYEDAEAAWDSLLALPAEQRHFRSVWAAFMLGKSSMFRNPDQAAPYFEKTRRLAEEGFVDSLHLAQESLGWQAMVEWNTGKVHPSFQRYLELFKTNRNGVNLSSLILLCPHILEKEPIDSGIIQDATCRRAVSAWLISCEYPGNGKEWLGAIQKVNPSLEPGEGSQLAWIAYKCGDFAGAKQWLSQEKQITPIGYWAQSKILLREGKIEEAMQALRQVKNYFPTYQEITAIAEIGILQLGRKEFIEALQAFALAGYWADAAYIAERVLTVDELKNYLKAHKDDEALKSARPHEGWSKNDSTVLPCLNYLLARRLVRENRWEEAGDYFPDGIRPYFTQFTSLVRKGRTPSLPAQERAEHLFAAGKLAREKGMEIMGTEDEPDWTITEGVYELSGASEYRLAGKMQQPVTEPENLAQALSANAKEKERSRASAPKPNHRFHYRSTAISLIWEAAKLLPDNDPLLARALYTGGQYAISIHNTPEADQFYKALVKRCRKLPIGEAADMEHWFPSDGESLLQQSDK